MHSLVDFDVLVIGLFRAPLPDVCDSIKIILEQELSAGRFEATEAALDIRSVYDRRPPAGGAHPLWAVVFEPANARGTAAMIANSEDGWFTMFNRIAGTVPGEHVLVRSVPDQEYPLASFDVWEGGSSVRSVRAMREDPSWEFFSRGEPRAFENPANYKQRRVADRLNREILVAYLNALGWDLASSRFWQTSLSAFYLQERRRRAS